MEHCYDADCLPMVLQAKDVQAILGISKGKTYELMNHKDFPTIFFGETNGCSKGRIS